MICALDPQHTLRSYIKGNFWKIYLISYTQTRNKYSFYPFEWSTSIASTLKGVVRPCTPLEVEAYYRGDFIRYYKQ